MSYPVDREDIPVGRVPPVEKHFKVTDSLLNKLQMNKQSF
jgi:hypothetical protein